MGIGPFDISDGGFGGVTLTLDGGLSFQGEGTATPLFGFQSTSTIVGDLPDETIYIDVERGNGVEPYAPDYLGRGIVHSFWATAIDTPTRGGDGPLTLDTMIPDGFPFWLIGENPNGEVSSAHIGSGGLGVYQSGGGKEINPNGMLASPTDDDDGNGGSGDDDDGASEKKGDAPNLRVLTFPGTGDDAPSKMDRLRQYATDLVGDSDGDDDQRIEAVVALLDMVEAREEAARDPLENSFAVRRARQLTWKDPSKADEMMDLARGLVAGTDDGITTPEEMIEVLRLTLDEYGRGVSSVRYKLRGPQRMSAAMSSDWTPPSAEERPRLQRQLVTNTTRYEEIFREVEILAYDIYKKMLEWGRVPLTDLAPRALVRALDEMHGEGAAAHNELEILSGVMEHLPSDHVSSYMRFHLMRMSARAFVTVGDTDTAIEVYTQALNDAKKALSMYWLERRLATLHRPEIEIPEIQRAFDDFSRIPEVAGRPAPEPLPPGLEDMQGSDAEIDIAAYRTMLRSWQIVERARDAAERELEGYQAGGGEAAKSTTETSPIALILDAEENVDRVIGDMGSLGRYGKTVERPAKEWLGTFRGRVNEAFGYGAALAERLKRVDPSTIDVLPQAERTAMQGYIAGNIPETRDGWAVLLSAIDKTHPYIHGESGLEDASLHFMMSELFNEALSEAYGENPGSLVALYRGRLAYVLTNPTLAAILIGRHVLDMDDAALSPLIKKAGVNGEKINRSLERIVKDSDCIRKLFREPSDHDDFTADENIPEIAHLDSLREPSEIDFALRSANLYEDRALLYLRAHVEKRSEFIHQHNLSYSWGSFRSDLETALNLYDGVLALEANNKQALEGRGRVGHILSRVFSDDDGGQDGGGSSGGGTSTPSGGQGGSAPADGGGGGATKTLNATSFSALNAIPHTMISSSWTMLGVPPHASFQTSTLSTGMPLWNAQLAGNVSTAMSTTPVFRGGTFHI